MESVESTDEAVKLHKRRLMSKYDSVKVASLHRRCPTQLNQVYVWFPGDPPHSYVLSRYLTARMLTVARIPFSKAVKIALRVKKYFVDHDLLNVSQEEVETCLADHMSARGYGGSFFQRLTLVNRFFREKRPLVLTLCGVPSIGKSTFTQQLAERFNISNVLQTDLVYEMQKGAEKDLFRPVSLFETPGLIGRDLVQEYERECLFVRSAIESEIQKVTNLALYGSVLWMAFQTVSEGKALVMEGVHLDPALYLPEFANLNAMTFPWDASTSTEGLHESGGMEQRPLYIPIVVTASMEDHQLLSREAIYRTGSRFFEAQTTPQGLSPVEWTTHGWLLGGHELFHRLRDLDQYLTQHRHPAVAYVHVSLSGTSEALDQLHDHFLRCISLAMQV